MEFLLYAVENQKRCLEPDITTLNVQRVQTIRMRTTTHTYVKFVM